jgi:tRNA uridine 5-carboxymethylaminomethyl modification enzyme
VTRSTNTYDLIVVGAGHAGCEAALAASRLGVSTALVTLNLDEIGRMPCNPSIGGPGKSQLVREIDALGGEMAQMTDAAMIHIRILNTSKGAAMQVRRAQVDRTRYKSAWKRTLEHAPNLSIIEGMVDRLVVERHRVAGVTLREGLELRGRAVIVAVGTFLNGRILLGKATYAAGRSGEPPAAALAKSLQDLGFALRRLKTGTPPRVHRASIDVTELERQNTSDDPLAFSFWSKPSVLPADHPVYVSHTNLTTHRIIQEYLEESSNYNGLIHGVGARHCPSLETKIVKFPERTSHKVFLEPEGVDSAEVYLQGIYTAFSPEVQQRIVRSIRGLERAHIVRYGHNIEYDFVNPIHLRPTLETRMVAGLFFAGQLNGTTGYEEAAAQGLMAGINAARQLQGQEELILSRGEAFLGVLVDDLVTKGVTEPYRMLPSRAEYRITLRESNADLRLSHIGHTVGLLSTDRYAQVLSRRRGLDELLARLQETRIGPADPINGRLEQRGSPPLCHNGASLLDLLRRPHVRLRDLIALDGLPASVVGEAEVEGKYAGYLAQQEREIARLRRMEELQIPREIDFYALENLSIEGRELLARVRPSSLGQATRIPGVSQADLSMLAIHLRR